MENNDGHHTYPTLTDRLIVRIALSGDINAGDQSVDDVSYRQLAQLHDYKYSMDNHRFYRWTLGDGLTFEIIINCLMIDPN